MQSGRQQQEPTEVSQSCRAEHGRSPLPLRPWAPSVREREGRMSSVQQPFKICMREDVLFLYCFAIRRKIVVTLIQRK